MEPHLDVVHPGYPPKACLDQLAFAVLSIDNRRRMVTCNRVGQRLIGTGCDQLFQYCGGDLRATNPALQRWLDQTKAALRDPSAPPVPPSTTSHLAAADDGSVWLLYLLARPDSDGNGHWVVLGFESSRASCSVVASMVTLGRLSPSESQVLQLMLAGSTAVQISQLRGTTRETARTQIKAVLRKLGLRRQAELIPLVMLVVASPLNLMHGECPDGWFT